MRNLNKLCNSIAKDRPIKIYEVLEQMFLPKDVYKFPTNPWTDASIMSH